MRSHSSWPSSSVRELWTCACARRRSTQEAESARWVRACARSGPTRCSGSCERPRRGPRHTSCEKVQYRMFPSTGRVLITRRGNPPLASLRRGVWGEGVKTYLARQVRLVFTAESLFAQKQCNRSSPRASGVRWAHRAVAAGVAMSPEPITSLSCGRSTKPRSRPSRRRRRRPKCCHRSTRSRPPSSARHHRAYRLELPRSSACQNTRLETRRPWHRRPRRMGTPTARLTAGNISTIKPGARGADLY